MKMNMTIEQRLTETASLEELHVLLSSGTMSEDERRMIESHIIVAEQLQHVKREYIPIPLKQSLYQLESPTGMKKFVREFRSSRIVIVLTMLFTFFGIILFTAEPLNSLVFILQIVTLSSLFGVVFYTLFKSKVLR